MTKQANEILSDEILSEIDAMYDEAFENGGFGDCLVAKAIVVRFGIFVAAAFDLKYS